MKTVTLTISGKTTTLVSDADGMFSLNELHKASGTSTSKRPGSWIRTQQAVDFINVFSSAQICAVKKINGGKFRGTYGIEQVVYAYAEWISPEFHAAVIEAFKAAVSGDGEKAVKVAQSVARADGISQRKQFASLLGRHGADRGDFRNMSDTINIAVLGSASSTLKAEKGLTPSARLRDHLSEEELTKLMAAEAIATMYLTLNEERTHGKMREAVYKAVDKFKSL
ncbi:DNA-binding protein, KilA-N domain [Aeromonas phage BUCT695]|uniref:DNA-binding protein, KilA-N domain n=1 Tax=Aeromonas phage BUCT695 TaxID=2908630 RepID=UPI0023292F7B|nr:DNA-binding protein, KilA-N domain [Aeromonas phage BUCT695]UIW10496.1 DNA-binding protein, KilA-N domain [Aeromonas phage BUCT695]